MSKTTHKKLLFGLVLIGTCIVSIAGCRNGQLISDGLSEEEKYEILREHNMLRQQVAMGQVSGQPGASNMQEMEWDENLARRAQQWASQCIYEHDPNRFDDRFSIGQNLAIIWSSAPLQEGDFPGRVRKWFNEVNIYTWGQGWTVRTGHYSQMIWAGTNLVGCGFSYYRAQGRYNKLYVCNYGPAGNVAGRLPYQPGYPKCTGYGMHTSKDYPGLCRIDDYENTIDGKPYVYSPYDSRYSRPGSSSAKYRLPVWRWSSSD
ncbi:venom allergen 5-like isoform X2 [Culicoides brevitarsis]|uniref:venom allergen 5-like isoform X2 n=1 Tax=Culicoides brevitarsis TaxID=469753 RepID=UPI00307C66CF